MTTQYYDIVVMGMEIGPLAAGALLAKAGFRVLVVGQNGARDRYPCLGYQFTRRPFTLNGGESPVFKRLIEDLAISQRLGLALSMPEPAFQLIAPRVRIDVSHNLSKTRREVRRELPEASEKLDEGLEIAGRLSGEVEKLLSNEFVLPPESFMEKREFSRIEVQNPFRASGFFNPRFDGPLLPDIFELPVTFDTAGADTLHPIARYRLLGHWLFDCAALNGGRDGLREILVDQIVGQGGDRQPRQHVTEIVVHRGKVTGVRTAGHRETVGCQVILTSLTPRELAPMIPPSAWPKRFQALVDSSPDATRGYAVNLGMAREVVPEGLAATAFVSDGTGLGPGLLRVERVPQEDERLAALHIACVVPKEHESTIESGALRDAILDRMRALVPFLDNYLEVIHSPFDRFGPISIAGDRKGEAPPAPHPEAVPKWLLRAPSPRGVLGVGALSHRTGIKGLLLSGEQVVSGLGLEGELIAARGAARIAGKMDPRRERLVRSLRSKVEM